MLLRNVRIRILKKILHYLQLNFAMKKLNIKRGANLYAFQYMIKNLNKYVKIKNVQEYCNKETQRITGEPLGDPPRAFEMLRKDKSPNDWHEIIYKKYKYVKYIPNINSRNNKLIISDHLFSNSIIENKLKECNYKCCITNLSNSVSFKKFIKQINYFSYNFCRLI